MAEKHLGEHTRWDRRKHWVEGKGSSDETKARMEKSLARLECSNHAGRRPTFASGIRDGSRRHLWAVRNTGQKVRVLLGISSGKVLAQWGLRICDRYLRNSIENGIPYRNFTALRVDVRNFNGFRRFVATG